MPATVVIVLAEPAGIFDAVLKTDPRALATAESVTTCACTLARGMALVLSVWRLKRFLYLCL